MKNDFFVSVRCISYNHASYIEDCMNGFTMQETNFPYVCVIDDDASTDGEPEVITNYLAEHFDIDDKDVVRREDTNDYRMIFAQHKTNKNCFFAVYFLKYNHYSIRKSRDSYVSRFVDGTKYMAICEGDDYWTDSQKLQKQVNFMESHPDFSMTCNRTKLFSQRRIKFVGENYCYKKSRCVDVKDVIRRGGLFISTCSILFRQTIMSGGLPDYMTKCHVGDYSLQILAAMKGKVYYFNEVMSVYRVDNSNSWVGKRKKISVERRIDSVRSEVDMLKGFALDYPQYSSFFLQRKIAYINRSLPNRKYSKSDQVKYLRAFEDELKDCSFIAKIDLWMRCLRLKGLGVLSPFNLSGKFVGRKTS